MSLLSVDDALARVLDGIAPLAAETIPLAQADGRVLAEPILARRDQPPFSSSVMDGYALRSTDAAIGATLNQVGVSQAGARYSGTVGPGECVRIFTGAPIPDGADAVIMQEETKASGSSITLNAKVSASQNIRPQGYDFRDGQAVLPIGTVLGPATLALAASANAAQCKVVRRPIVALVATGDELVAPGETPGPDQIVSANSVALAALCARAGAEVRDLGIVRDDPASLAQTFEAALSGGADILVTTGGASVGEHDFVQAALKEIGVDIGFWRIAMRPGKPLMFGRRGQSLVFGLPGNPVSAIATAMVFVVPPLHALLGRPQTQWGRLPLLGNLPANGIRRQFIRARYGFEEHGERAIIPAPAGDSGHLSSLAQAEAFIVQPENDEGKSNGDFVQVIPLDS